MQKILSLRMITFIEQTQVIIIVIPPFYFIISDMLNVVEMVPSNSSMTVNGDYPVRALVHDCGNVH